MRREEVRMRIEEIGIVPAIRVSSPEAALMAAEAVAGGGIPIVEVTTTIPGAAGVIAVLRKQRPGLIVGAGTILGAGQAAECIDAGAHFLTSPGLDLEIVEFAMSREVAVIPGALTPTEVMAARKAGADLIKIFPCAPLGGPGYIKALRAPFPDARFIASGGVNEQNAGEFIAGGATAIGVGGHLIPRRAVELGQPHRIHELARRFVNAVHEARALCR